MENNKKYYETFEKYREGKWQENYLKKKVKTKKKLVLEKENNHLIFKNKEVIDNESNSNLVKEIGFRTYFELSSDRDDNAALDASEELSPRVINIGDKIEDEIFNPNKRYKRQLSRNERLKRKLNYQRNKYEYKKKFNKKFQNRLYADKFRKEQQKQFNKKILKDKIINILNNIKLKSKTIVLVLTLIFFIIFLMVSISSCSVLLKNSVETILSTSYLSEDYDLIETEKYYCRLEKGLLSDAKNMKNNYPNYDAYNYHLEEMNHDKYVLLSLVSAKNNLFYEIEANKDLISEIFNIQYELYTEEIVETRYKTVRHKGYYYDTDPVTGKERRHSYTYTEVVAYDYYILDIYLKNHGINTYINKLDKDELGLFNNLIINKGNREDLFD